MAAKIITLDWSATGITAYCIVRRESDSYLLNDADGSFAVAPADYYLSLVEDTVIKGRYEASEGRSVWLDGLYTVIIYQQSGASPAPASDTIIGTGKMYVANDAEVVTSPTAAEVRQEIDANSTQVAAILTDTGTTIPAQISSLNNLSSTDVTNAIVAYDPATGTEAAAISASIAALNNIDVASVVSGVAAMIVESNGSITLKQALSTILAAEVGQYDAVTDVFKDHTGTNTRIDSSSDGSGNRGTSILTPSP